MTDKEMNEVLFGGDSGWKAADWTASDDRVRGGKSQSYLTCHQKAAVFYGTLDIKALGGAGFASQRTTTDSKEWDLSAFDGIELELEKLGSDDKQYTFIMKDHLVDPSPESGREQATLSWEIDFTIPTVQTKHETVSIFLCWQDFRPTYRGKEQQSKRGPDLRSMKRFSIMMRSFFGSQQGDFCLTIVSILAKKSPTKSPQHFSWKLSDDTSPSMVSLKKHGDSFPVTAQSSLWHWLLGKCGKL